MSSDVPNIWNDLKKPLYILAPMAGITNTAFRQIFLTTGKPDIFMTEFISCAGLCSPGKEKLLPDFDYTPGERPIIAQLFGSRPEHFEEVAGMVAERGFDGIDINTGCPDKKVQRQESGAMLMQNPELTKKIIRATKRGAKGLPVSVKTRIGYYKENIEEWMRHLLEEEPAAVSIHFRTKSQMYKGAADWSLAETAVSVVQELKSKSLIIGNGDIMSMEQADDLIQKTGVDGVMIGRAAIANPWIFNSTKKSQAITPIQRLETFLLHLDLFEKSINNPKQFFMIRKHVKSYINDIPSAKRERMKFLHTTTPDEMRTLIFELIDAIKNFEKDDA